MSASGRMAAAGAAIGLDRVLGEPPAAVHPVARFGSLMAKAEGKVYSDDRARGALHAAGGVALATAAGMFVRGVAPGPVRRLAASTSAAWVTVGGRALEKAALEVSAPLEAGDLEGARAALPALVGRDPSALGEKEIVRAVVESVAENTVDAVVAPALWAAVGGAPAAFGYRAVNTLDAMVGHRSARYEKFGWASARADDAANWFPARSTAALVAAVRPREAKTVWRAVRDQAPAHPSPNAGVAEAAFAAALGVTLEGINTYGGRAEQRPPLGYGPPPQPADIRRAIRLSRDVAIALAGVLVLPASTRLARSLL